MLGCLAIKECFTGTGKDDLYISTETGVSYYRHVTCMTQIHRKFNSKHSFKSCTKFFSSVSKNGILSVFDENYERFYTK